MLSNALGADPAQGDSNTFMPVGVWFEGSAEWLGVTDTHEAYGAYLERCFRDIAESGLNCVTVPNPPPAYESLLLDVAASHNLKVVLEIRSARELISDSAAEPSVIAETAAAIAERHATHPALLRYQIRDEPPPAWMPAWLAMQRALRRVDPAHPSFSCFNNPQSLVRAREASALTEAVFDIYPLKTAHPFGDMDGFRTRLTEFLDAAGSLPPWIVLQAFAKEDVWRYPSPVELRHMTYNAMVRGAKGYFFFIYQTLPHHPERLRGLVDAQLEPLDLLIEVRGLAERLQRLAPTLLTMVPAESFARVPQGIDACCYRLDDGSLGVAVVNRDLEKSRYVPIVLSESVRPKPNRVTDLSTGVDTSFLWDVEPHSTRILVGPGEGTIVRFWKQEEAR